MAPFGKRHGAARLEACQCVSSSFKGSSPSIQIFFNLKNLTSVQSNVSVPQRQHISTSRGSSRNCGVVVEARLALACQHVSNSFHTVSVRFNSPIPGMNMKVPFGWSSSFQLPVVCLISRCSSAELWDPAVTKWLALCEMNFKQRKRSRWERRHLIGSGVMSDQWKVP